MQDEVLARLVRDLADAVIICDPDGTIVFWNTAVYPGRSVGRRSRSWERHSM